MGLGGVGVGWLVRSRHAGGWVDGWMGGWVAAAGTAERREEERRASAYVCMYYVCTW